MVWCDLSCCILLLSFLYTNILNETIIVNVIPQTFPAEYDNTKNPKPVADMVTEVEVVAILTKRSTITKKSSWYFKKFMFLLWFTIFVFEVSNHFFKSNNRVTKAVYFIRFRFWNFFNLVTRSKGAEGQNLVADINIYLKRPITNWMIVKIFCN